MKKTFIIATMDTRMNSFAELLMSLKSFFDDGWSAVAVAQGYSDDQKDEIESFVLQNEFPCKIVHCENYIGPHSAKIIGLNSVKSDIWCSMDDDMEAFENTKYNEMSDILCQNKSFGFVSGNWAKTKEMARKKNLTPKLVKQNLVYTGGGLMFRDDVAEIIRGIPNKDYLMDDCLWAMYAYINGYTNFRYLGSVAIHKVCTKGGRKIWIGMKNNRTLPPPDLLGIRESKQVASYGIGNSYYIPVDKDLTSKAHELHKKMKERHCV